MPAHQATSHVCSARRRATARAEGRRTCRPALDPKGVIERQPGWFAWDFRAESQHFLPVRPEAGLVAKDEHGDQVEPVLTISDSRVLGFARPGKYRIIMPVIEGYLPVAPFDVEVHRGETVTHTI